MGRMMSTKEAAEFLGVSVQTLNVWRMTGRYNLPYVKVGRIVRYRESDLQAFVARQMKGERLDG